MLGVFHGRKSGNEQHPQLTVLCHCTCNYYDIIVLTLTLAELLESNVTSNVCMSPLYKLDY